MQLTFDCFDNETKITFKKSIDFDRNEIFLDVLKRNFENKGSTLCIYKSNHRPLMSVDYYFDNHGVLYWDENFENMTMENILRRYPNINKEVDIVYGLYNLGALGLNSIFDLFNQLQIWVISNPLLYDSFKCILKTAMNSKFISDKTIKEHVNELAKSIKSRCQNIKIRSFNKSILSRDIWDFDKIANAIGTNDPIALISIMMTLDYSYNPDTKIFKRTLNDVKISNISMTNEKLSCQDVTIHSLSEFNTLLLSFNGTYSMDEIHVICSPFIYRGQSNKNWDVLPSLARFNTRLENSVINEFKKKLPVLASQADSSLKLLQIAQYHGIPTRLLDVTANPYVALYFACKDNNQYSSDGRVIILQTDQQIYFDEYHNFAYDIASTYKLFFENCEEIALSEFKEKIIDINNKNRVQENSTNDISATLIDYSQKNFIVNNIINEEQRLAQHSGYIIFSNEVACLTNDENYNINNYIFKNNIKPMKKEDIYMNIIVPASCKPRLLQELQLIGITQSSLFPDSIERICEDITNTIFHL